MKSVLDEILNLIESVSEGFPSYFCHASLTFLAHLSLLRMSFWDTAMSVVRRTCGRS